MGRSKAIPRFRSQSIIIVTPAPAGSQKGNRITAERWAGILGELGHRVRILDAYHGESADVLIALHATKSAAAVRKFAKLYPDRPLVVALTGTDLYHDLKTSDAARRSLELASRLIVLQPEAVKQLPPQFRHKARGILQSVLLPKRLRPRRLGHKPGDHFRVCVIGHLRAVKDPFRAAMASRLLPAESTVQVVQIGGATTEAMAERARRAQDRNPRYRWIGELPRKQALALLAQSNAMVLSSKMEGGANVISEAIVLGVPVIASRIPGSVGLLGSEYPGYFPVGDTANLARLLRKLETDPEFYAALYRHCRKLRPLFRPTRERDAWSALLKKSG